jgi:DNA (cytosine-5)-methyltransferase 1
MRYLSVCSGIEAASVAWESLGWTPVGFAEIEPFPSEVLKTRYPNVPNYGNLENYKDWPIEPGTVDVLVGGPPCQAFSVAGMREGMDDPRGNLSLIYFGLVKRLKPKWIVYENVPGLLSSKSGSDFSALLTALADCGYGFCYRVLDAQFYGLPQRRRRIFLIGCSSGDWRHSAAVLFDGPGSFGGSTTKPTSWKGTPPPSFTGVDGSSRINCRPDGISGTVTRKWHKGTGGPAGDEHYNLLATGPGDGAGDNGGDVGGVDPRPIVLDRAAYSQGVNAKFDPLIQHSDSVPALVARGPHAVQPPIAFKVRCGGEYSGTKGGEVKPTERGGTGMLHYEDKTFTVAATQDQFVATPQQVVYENHPNDSRVTGPHDVAPTVAARFGTGGGNVPFVQSIQGVDLYNQALTGDIHCPLRTAGGHGAPAVMQECISFQPGNLRRDAGAEPNAETTTTLKASMGDQIPHIATPMAVRRLLPSECEALQGFPKGWTDITWNGKPAPDGHRYKAIGNSMATNCMHWIGRRIQMVDDLVTELNNKQG